MIAYRFTEAIKHAQYAAGERITELRESLQTLKKAGLLTHSLQLAIAREIDHHQAIQAGLNGEANPS
jgi:hypothetical protein